MTNSKSNTLPKFNSTSLSNAISEAGPAIAQYQQSLDRISADIKLLENFLSNSGINIPVRIQVNESVMQLDGEYDFGGGFLPEYVDGCPINVEREFLIWDTDQNGKFRLQYQRSVHDGYMDLDGGGDRPYRTQAVSLEHEVRPLIECKIEIRLKMMDSLPNFVAAFSQKLRPFSSLAQQPSMAEQLEKLAQVVDWKAT